MRSIDDIRARLDKVLKHHPLPWSGIAASWIRDSNKHLIVSVENNTDSEADFIRECASDIEYLLEMVTLIQDAAAPLRYAVKHPQHGTQQHDNISAGDGFLYAGDEDGFLKFSDLQALVNAIDDDFPEVVIPPYKDEAT